MQSIPCCDEGGSAMNNLDYLEYEGSRLLDYAMKTYSKTSTGCW